MPTLVELEQLLDISLTTPEVGTVNFNILRVFLREILRHLNIQNKMIDIDFIADELKSAYDFIKDGYVEVSRGRTPSPVRPHTEPVKRPQAESTVRPHTEPTEMPQTIVPERQSEVDQAGEQEGQLTGEQTAEQEQEGTLKAEQAGEEQRQVLVVESKSESLESSSSPPKSAGLVVKEPPAPSRSAVMLLGRSDSLKNLKKKVAELQERVEFLESQPVESTPAAPVPDPVRSAASLVRKDSKTPAHDFVELINIKRKLEASENSLEGLTEMVDALTSDLDELKNSLPDGLKETYNDMRSEIKEIKISFGKQDREQDEEISKRLEKLEEDSKRMYELESTFENLKEAMGNEETVRVATDLPPKELPGPVTEALQALNEHEKQLKELEAQILEVKGKSEGADEKSSVVGQAANEALTKLEECGEGINDIRDILKALEKQLKDQKSLIEDNEMQIHQLKNAFTLMKRQSLEQLERANEEAEKKKEKEKVVEEETSTTRRRSYSVDRDELSLIRTMIFDLQEEKDKLKQTDIRLSDELYKKQRHLDDLYNLIDELRDAKADKELLSIGFELKADKREVEAKIGREDFEHYVSLVDQSLRDLLQRLDGHEDALKQALEGVNSDVGRKLDKEEVEPLKRYLEARMESMKPKPVEKPPPEEFAAGIRKQFLVNHNCISCDRPVKYAREEAFPPLPIIHSMPGSKSNRPYTTFELEQIRQHMLHRGLDVGKERFELLDKQRNKLQKEILRLSGVRDLQELAEVTARACGGVHTLTYPHSQAVVRGLQLNSEFDFLVPQKDCQPVDILGQDGHIYKGLLDSLPTLPHIPQKSKSAGMRNPPRDFRRSTTPTSPNIQKTLADEVESS